MLLADREIKNFARSNLISFVYILPDFEIHFSTTVTVDRSFKHGCFPI